MMLEGGADLEAIREAYSQLEAATFEIAEAMYSGESDGEGTASYIPMAGLELVLGHK
jgi:hypothetical protein